LKNEENEADFSISNDENDGDKLSVERSGA